MPSSDKVKLLLARVNGGIAICPLPDFQIDVEAGYGKWVLFQSEQKD